MSKTELSAGEVKSMLLTVADRVIAAEPELSEADRNLGDGDHGLGMKRGMTAVKEKLGAMPEGEAIDRLFSAAGMAMMSSMGGASGAIFGTLFRDGGKALVGKGTFAAPELAAFFRSACDGVMARGKAKPGDKTMVDALHPAAEKAAVLAGASLADAVTEVAAAAAAGMDSSKAMVATLGRAKSLGQGSVGYPDAGALSVTVICEAMRDFIAG